MSAAARTLTWGGGWSRPAVERTQAFPDGSTLLNTVIARKEGQHHKQAPGTQHLLRHPQVCVMPCQVGGYYDITGLEFLPCDVGVVLAVICVDLQAPDLTGSLLFPLVQSCMDVLGLLNCLTDD